MCLRRCGTCFACAGFIESFRDKYVLNTAISRVFALFSSFCHGPNQNSPFDARHCLLSNSLRLFQLVDVSKEVVLAVWSDSDGTEKSGLYLTW